MAQKEGKLGINMKDIEELDVSKSSNVPQQEIWSAEVEKKVWANAVMADYVRVNNTLLNTDANVLHLPIEDTKVSASDITDGTATPTTFSFTTRDVTPKNFGAAVSIHKDAIAETNIDAIRTATDQLGKAIADKQDNLLLGTIAQHAAGTVSAASGDGAGNLKYKDIQDAVDNVRAKDYNPNLFVINPNTESEIGTIDEFIHASKYGDSDMIQEGVLGRVLGMDVVMTTNVPEDIINASGGTASCIVCESEEAAVLAPQSRVDVEEDYETLGQTHQILASQRFGIRELNKDSVQIISTD